jgi:hypothetical protein
LLVQVIQTPFFSNNWETVCAPAISIIGKLADGSTPVEVYDAYIEHLMRHDETILAMLEDPSLQQWSPACVRVAVRLICMTRKEPQCARAIVDIFKSQLSEQNGAVPVISNDDGGNVRCAKKMASATFDILVDELSKTGFDDWTVALLYAPQFLCEIAGRGQQPYSETLENLTHGLEILGMIFAEGRRQVQREGSLPGGASMFASSNGVYQISCKDMLPWVSTFRRRTSQVREGLVWGGGGEL